MRSPGGGRGSLCHRPPSPAPQASWTSILKGAMHAAAPHLQEAFPAQGSRYPQEPSTSRHSNLRLLSQYARVLLPRPSWTGPVAGFSPSLSLCSREDALPERASPAPVRPGDTDSRARKGPYLRLPRLSSPRPLEMGIQLSALHEKLLGDVVCLRSLISGTRGRGAGFQTHRCAPQSGAVPPYL